MHEFQRLQARAACEDLINRFCEQRDSGHATQNLDLFTDDGLMSTYKWDGAGWSTFLRASGRRELSVLFAERQARADRRTKHLVTNVLFTEEHSSLVQCSSSMLLYVLDPTEPQRSLIPTTISECHDKFVPDGKGSWLIAERRVNLLIRNE
jgi:hypothetical protein